jgi:WD40 repeat protein
MSNQYSLIAIKNVIELTKYETKDLTLMNLNYSQTQVSATTIAKNLEKYLLTKSMFFPTNPEKPIFNEQTFYNVKNIKNINVTNIQNKLSREYGKHFVQIKHVLILDEKLIVIATSHSTIKVINLSSLKSIMKFKEHSSGVNYLCASNNKTFLSCGEDNLLIKWSYETLIPYKLKFIMKLTIKMNSKFKLKSHSGPVIQCLNLSDDMEYFISVSKDKTFIIWNNSSKHPFPVSTSKTCLDSNIIAICIIEQFQLVSVSEDKKVIKWRINSDFKVERQVNADIEVGCSGVGSLKKINDNLVLIGNEEGINVLDVHTFTFVNKISGEGMDNIGGICCLSATTAIVGNLKYMFVINLNYFGKDWEVKNKKEIRHLRQVNGIEILMDSHKNIITFGHDSTIKLWGYQIGV